MLILLLVTFAGLGIYLHSSSNAATTPQLAIYRGAAGDTSGNKAGSGIDKVSAWLGRDVLLGEDFNADANWADIEGQSWQLDDWGPWVNAKAGRNYIHSVSPFPSSGGSLSDCASGAYDYHWQKLGQNLVNNKLQNTYLRFGWEMNANFMRWSSFGKEAAFVGCTQKFVTAMRSVPGSNFKFAWNINGGYSSDSIYLSKIYPGNEFVDFIATDQYDQAYSANTYPYPSPCDSVCVATRQQNAWNEVLNSQGAGLKAVSAFAQSKGKPLAIGEWGVFNRPDGHGGLDNPYFVQKMAEWINDPVNNVAWHVYFDFNAPDGSHQLSPVPSTFVTEFPLSKEKFKSIYSVDATTPTTVITGDVTPPTISITLPTNSSTISGAVKPQATASDNISVTKVEFYLDGTLVRSEASAPYCFNGDVNQICNDWDTSSVADGAHTMTAQAYDAAGNTMQAISRFTVANIAPPPPSDTTPPTVTVTIPANGSVVSAAIRPQATASDNVGIQRVEFALDTNPVITEATSPYCLMGDTSGICNIWDTTSVVDGTHTLSAKAYDAAGNTTSHKVTFTVSNQVVVMAGDVNKDGRVNAIDLSLLLRYDGTNYPAADFNKDGTVGSADLAILLSKWTW